MRIDRYIENAFGENHDIPFGVKTIRPDGLSLLVLFESKDGAELEVKLYPAGEAPSACASNKYFDVVYLSRSGNEMEEDKRRMIERVVDTILRLEPGIGYSDWEETLGEQADSRFLCGPAVEIKLTRRCNQKCIFCKSSAKLENYATALQMPELLARLAKKSDFITFSGGETCLDPLLEKHIDTARQSGFKSIEVQTNGMLMQDGAYVRRLIKAGMSNVLVSLHSHMNDISDAITCKSGGFRATLKGIETLLRENVHVSLCHVICSLNYRHIPDYVSFIKTTFPVASMTIVNTLAIPTYRVRYNPKLMPRLSDIAPFLQEGLSMCLPSKNQDGISLIEDIVGRVEAVVSRSNLIGPPVRKMLRKGEKLLSGSSLHARVISHCGLPLCFLKGYEQYHDEYTMSGSFPADFELFHPDACGSCRWKKNCSGIWRLYASTYGESEIKPVT